MKKPLVSVIIPAHNGEKYLRQAIQSILDQDYPNIEILVLDNGSIDKTAEVAKNFAQVCYHYSAKANTGHARNLGISFARGEYLAFLDQDDTYRRDKLTKQVQFLEENSRYGAVICQQRMFLEQGCEKPHWLKKEFLQTAQPAYLPSALLVRRGVFEVTKEFESQYLFSSDVAWFFKAKQEGILIGMIEEALIDRRIHGENHSNQSLRLQKELLMIIKASLGKRRGQGQGQ